MLGVGEKITNVLLINLPELGLINNKEIASLVGGSLPKLKKAAKKYTKLISQAVDSLLERPFIWLLLLLVDIIIRYKNFILDWLTPVSLKNWPLPLS